MTKENQLGPDGNGDAAKGSGRTLRQQAEELFRETAAHLPEDLATLSPEETRQTLHELRVHQIELEIQNEELRRTQGELLEERTRYFDLYDLAPVGYITLNERGLILEANLTAATMLVVARRSLLNRPITLFIPKEDQDIFYRHRKQLIETGGRQSYELRMVKKDSTVFWAHLNATAGQDTKGEPVYRIAISDINTIKQTEETLRASEELYRFLVRNTSDYVARYSLNGELLFASEAISFMLGYNPEEIIGTSGLSRMHPDDRLIVQEALKKASEIAKDTNGKVEYRALCQDGSYKWVELSGKKVWNDHADRMEIIANVRDITERKHLEEELREASLHDLLTCLYNRRGFFALAEQQVKAAIRAHMKLSLTYFDCDDFKWINDSLGHEQGDKVLVDTAYILRQTFRESDIVARIGGDEFVVLSLETADVDPAVFLKRLQQNIDEYNVKETRRYKLALSWGTVVYDPESPKSLDALLSQADKLMYVHKNAKANKQSSWPERHRD